MSNYLKKILFFLLILMMPYMTSASKAMNTEEYEGSSVRSRKVNFIKEDQQEIQFFTKKSTFSSVESLKDSQNSWSSYLSSPVKSMFYGAYEIVKFAIQRPKLAMVVGLSYIIQSAAALCHCYCEIKGYVGIAENSRHCNVLCSPDQREKCPIILDDL